MVNRRLTFELTNTTEPLMEEFELGSDIRHIINGAIITFSKLSGNEQKQAIIEAKVPPKKRRKVKGG